MLISDKQQESGAHDALNQGYLHKLNLSIAHVDDGPITEGNLIESYTIKFFYESGNVTSRIYSETGQKNARISGPVILTDVKNGARKLIDNVAGYLWNNSKRGVLKDHPLPGECAIENACLCCSLIHGDLQPPSEWSWQWIILMAPRPTIRLLVFTKGMNTLHALSIWAILMRITC
jgi:hypothetical protein